MMGRKEISAEVIQTNPTSTGTDLETKTETASTGHNDDQ